MSIVERLSALLGLGKGDPVPLGTPGLRDAIETARKAKFSEDYPRALAALDRGLEIVKDQADGAGAVVILLQKADVYTRSGEHAEAEHTLEAARARAGDHQVQVAYVIASQGALALAQGRPDEARTHYEHALQIAKDINSPGAEGRARGLLGQICLQDGNASYAVHLLKDALSKLNLAADVELSPLFFGLLGQATIEMGQTAEGTHMLERALHLAHSMGDRASERNWAIALGDRAFQEGSLQEARARYQTAFGLFSAPGSAQRVQLEVKLSKTCTLLRLYDEALNYAEGAIEGSDGLDAEVVANAQCAMGIALRSLGRNAEAITHLRAAIDTAEPSIDALRALSGALADTGATEEALATYQRAIVQAEQHGTRLDKAVAWRDIGLTHYKAKRVPEAITAWLKALELYEAEGAHAQVARLYSDIGSARKQMGHHQRAIRDYERALTALNNIHDSDIETRGVVLSNAANAFAEQGDADSADSFFNEAIALAEKLGDKASESTRRSNYAYFLVQTGRPRRAITLLEEALRQSHAHDHALPVAIQLDNLGLAHDASSEYAAGLDYHKQALAAVEPLGEPYWESSIQINLANTQLALGQVDEADPLLQAALSYARAHEHTDLLARALTSLGLVALKRRDTVTAAPLLDEAVTVARRAELRRWLADALSAQSELRAAEGDPSGAQSLWEEATRLYNALRMPQGKRSPVWLSPEHKA
jgi:tetratricopeptide (TPR) repeat protein